jgi:integrase
MARGDEPTHKYKKEKNRVKNSDLSDDDKEAVLAFLEAYSDNGEASENLGYNTLETYGRALRLIRKESDCDLLNHTNESLKSVFDTMLYGEGEDDDGLANQTVRQREAASIKFYRFTDDHQVEPDDIPLAEQGDTSVDERDMFTAEDVKQLREACNNTRDRCLIELLLYTGQRIRALQTLRIRDIDLENNVYYLNTEADGLKGADKSGKKRPLLGATKAVREWLKHHPTGEPDDYLITPLPSATNTTEDKGDYLSAPSIRGRLNTIADRAGVDKPNHAHNFRHHFVTTAHREYDMDVSTIKHLIGHKPDSTVMENTYSHLTDDDHIQEARSSAQGVGKEPEDETRSLSPETCPTCDENLSKDASACPSCGSVFTPDAKAVQDEIRQDMYQNKAEAEGDEEEALDKLKDLVKENPSLVEELTD